MPLVIGGGLPGVGIGVIWIPHYPAVAPTRVAACPVAPKKDSLLCKEVSWPRWLVEPGLEPGREPDHSGVRRC